MSETNENTCCRCLKEMFVSSTCMTCSAIQSERIEQQAKQIEALTKLVKAAYYEGYLDANNKVAGGWRKTPANISSKAILENKQ